MQIKNINARRERIDENNPESKDVLILYNEFWQEIARSEEQLLTENCNVEYKGLNFMSPPESDNEFEVYISLSTVKDFVNNYKKDDEK